MKRLLAIAFVAVFPVPAFAADPTLEDLKRFSTPAECKKIVDESANTLYSAKRSLENAKDDAERDRLGVFIERLLFVHLTWRTLQDAQNEQRPDDERIRRLVDLKERLGKKAYAKGQMLSTKIPEPIPAPKEKDE